MPAIKSFDPEKNIPDLSGKIILVTGGNQGIGKETVLALAQHGPSHLYFTARSTAKAEQTLAELKKRSPDTPVTVITCDLASLASVKKAAQDFLSKSNSLDVLILSAGIMAVPPAQTADGYEIQMGTNHIGHALLTKLLLPTLEQNAKTRDTRIVVVSSSAALMARGIDYGALKTDGKSRTVLGGTQILYCESKLANVYFAQQLAEHYSGITSVSVHPGVVRTHLIESQSTLQKTVIKLSAYITQSELNVPH
ncbi:hypothetical protein, variant [Verruconis gallopava]|uniref:Ketoreductase domain-containing protein n=1 Tax=Verruconis gallopava TaxID=253628 RepID=A0A0D2A671_9PEZI|nr:hypothetical protein, variant [Verruconis gallopava]KIW02015.1 hypothetical protein, variant [Verruconis gallopava]